MKLDVIFEKLLLGFQDAILIGYSHTKVGYPISQNQGVSRSYRTTFLKLVL